MLKEKLKNSGMTLVEVIISMLVLSIAAVTVMTAFSMATKANTSAKMHQSTESLMENLSEYTEAGGTDYKGWFHVSEANYDDITPETTPGVTPTVKVEQLSEVKEGFFNYTVKITTDTKPAEYETDQLNKHGVIQFGGTGSNTIMINASEDDDTAFYADYYQNHKDAVEDHNEEEEALFAADPTHTKDLWTELSETEVYDKIDREIWISVVNDALTGMIHLTAYKVYIIEDDLKLRTDTARTVETLIYASEEYDRGDSADPDAKKLNQIYLMYPNVTLGTGALTDVRIWDPEKTLNANLFIVKQVDVTEDVEDAIGMTDRFMPGEQIRLSCKHPETGAELPPAALRVYNSVDTVLNETVSEITTNDRTLIARGDEVRLVKVTIEIYDEAGTKLLASKEMTRLQ